MKWYNIKTGLFECLAQNKGVEYSYRDILLCQFGVPHRWFYRENVNPSWVNGVSNDIQTIMNVRRLDTNDPEYQKIKYLAKQTTQCYTPSANYACKKKGQEELKHINPVLQLDWDNLTDYDLEEVRAAIAALSFIGFVGKSISGYGLYALALIDEPERLEQYAEHCFVIFDKYGLPVDTSKGRNYNDLRFVSVDGNMRFNEDPKPLRIKRFNTPKIEAKPKPTDSRPIKFNDNSGLLTWAIREIQNAQVGNRFEIVRKVSYTMGGAGYGLDEIKAAINEGNQYTGVEAKYLMHADEGFAAGKAVPLKEKAA